MSLPAKISSLAMSRRSRCGAACACRVPMFAGWLRRFLLPQIAVAEKGGWLQPVVSPDPSDPKLAHLDGPEPESRMDVGRNRCESSQSRQTPADDYGGCQGAQTRRACSGDGQTLRRWSLAGEFCSYLVTSRGIPQKGTLAAALARH